MLAAPQQRAVDRFAKSLQTLADEALIDAYHQAWEDHRDARAEGSDNLDKACAESLATERAMRGALFGLSTPLQTAVSVDRPSFRRWVAVALALLRIVIREGKAASEPCTAVDHPTCIAWVIARGSTMQMAVSAAVRPGTEGPALVRRYHA